jgi:hypothetical protein
MAVLPAWLLVIFTREWAGLVGECRITPTVHGLARPPDAMQPKKGRRGKYPRLSIRYGLPV